jgi:23S rRNA pseudouridine1911/1915/1917 synthase
VGKKYHALVHGNPAIKEFHVSAPVDGLAASTRVRVVDSVPGAAHVIAFIETGRTHQIRRHLASVRHPVIGDSEYAPPRLNDARFREVPRQMLHASEIALPHPVTGARFRAACPLPADFRLCMKMLGLT